jgi:hypothetical protein
MHQSPFGLLQLYIAVTIESALSDNLDDELQFGVLLEGALFE